MSICAITSISTGLQAQSNSTRPVPGVVTAPRFPLPPEERSADSTHFSFIFYGGMRGREDGNEIAFEHSLVMQVMLDTIANRKTSASPIRFILSNGDAVLDGRFGKQWTTSWVPIVDRLSTESGLPYFLAAGNHDVTESGNANASGRRDGLRNLLKATSELIPREGDKRRLSGYPTYSFGYGNTFFIAFDSNVAEDRKQLDWVASQLNGLDRRRYTNVILFCHHPAYSSGPHGYKQLERQTIAMRTKVMPLVRRYHVRLVLAGHDHLYEHWVERYADSTGWHRLDQIVSGGGGAPLYTYQGEPDLSVYLGAGSQDSVRVEHMIRPGPEPSDNPYHFVIIRVDGDELSLEVIGVAGGEGFRPYPKSPVSLNDPPNR